MGTSRSFLGGKVVSTNVRPVNGTWCQSFTYLHIVLLLLKQTAFVYIYSGGDGGGNSSSRSSCSMIVLT